MAKPEEFRVGAVFLIRIPDHRYAGWNNIIYTIVKVAGKDFYTIKYIKGRKIPVTIWGKSEIARYSILLDNNNIWKILYGT